MSIALRKLCCSAVLASCAMAHLASVARAETTCVRRSDTLGWYVPDRVKLQTGGQLGLMTVGVGYEAWGVLGVDLYYGFVPAAVGGTDVHTGAMRIDVQSSGSCLTRDLRWRHVTFGLGALFTAGEWFFLTHPEGYPADYYDQTALRAYLSLGTSLELRLPDDHPFATAGVFVEVTALDVYAHHWITNISTVPFWDVWSTSLGVRIGL